MAEPAHSSRPSVSVSIKIDPPVFTLNEPPTLSLTMTLHHSAPITVYTWETVVNLGLAQRRHNFYCLDLDAGRRPLNLETTKGPRRIGFITKNFGGPDDQDYFTLLPEQPKTISKHLFAARPSAESLDHLETGHQYEFGVRPGEGFHWWQDGTREEVLGPPGRSEPRGDPTHPPIIFPAVEPVNISVREA